MYQIFVIHSHPFYTQYMDQTVLKKPLHTSFTGDMQQDILITYDYVVLKW